MADSSGDSFILDLTLMDNSILLVQKLADEAVHLQEDFQEALTKATYGWYGQSRTEFDKKAHMLFQNVQDISQELYDISEYLVTASESYIQADVDLAKTQDGVSNRF